MRISRQLYDEVVAYARAEAPNECCGMIAASDGRAVSVHPARNAARSPKLRYEMHGQDQYDILMAIDEAGNEIGAIYHSHPRTEAYPSLTDMAWSEQYPDAEWIIVGHVETEPVVRSFRVTKQDVDEVELEVG